MNNISLLVDNRQFCLHYLTNVCINESIFHGSEWNIILNISYPNHEILISSVGGILF